MDESIRLSVVTPVYNAEECLGDFAARVSTVLAEITDSWEIILVDDGSSDGSWDRIAAIARELPRLRGVRLSRNFGQHLAIAAGLAASKGARVVVMDCDLQDPPEFIHRLVERADEGFDVVATVRRSRSTSLLRRAGSAGFYFLARLLSAPYVRPNANTLSLLDRKVVTAYLKAFDRYSPYPFIVNWLGFRATSLAVDQDPRVAGSSAYTFSKLFGSALNSLVSQSTRLLHASTVVGLLFGLISVIQVVLIVYFRLTRTIVVPGWASLMAVLWLIGGTILFFLGVIGLYITRVFEQTLNRPFFVVSDSTED